MNSLEKKDEDGKHDKILFVDDEAFILFSLRRYFKQNNIEVDVETDCLKAIELIKENKYKVIISDFRMPTMNGAAFLELAKEVSPESVRLVLSAHIDQEALQAIVNKSEVFRYVSKPWSDKDLLATIREAIQKHDTIPTKLQLEPAVEADDFINNILPFQSLENLDTKKLSELLRTEQHQHLNYIINLASSKIANHSKRTSQLAAYVGKALSLPLESQKNLYYAALYHDVGRLFELVAQADHCELGANLVSNFSELKASANIIRNHHKNIDSPDGNSIPIESRILAIIDYFDKEVNKEIDRELEEKPRTITDIIGTMLALKGTKFDSDIMDRFADIIQNDFKLESFFNESKLHLSDIQEGMMLSRPLFNIQGKLLLNSEFKITKDVITRLYKHHRIVEIQNPIYVYTKTPEKVFNFEELIVKKIKI